MAGSGGIDQRSDMGTSREHTAAMPKLPLTDSEAHPTLGPDIEPTAGSEMEMRSHDQDFPTLRETSISSISSSLHKARVRAALFCKPTLIKIGRFMLLEQIGIGAMGEIYSAYDEQLDRRVALKLCRYGSEITQKADELLLREAKALAKLSHPNVVHVYEVGEHDGQLFIAMELVRGQTLTRWLREVAQLPRPHRQREILRRFIAAGRGLEAAHAAGVVHRDFKPDNVLVGEDGRVRVVDFGLARVLVDDPTIRSPVQVADGDRPIIADGDAAHADTVVRDGDGTPVDGDDVVGESGANAPRLPKLTAATRLTRTGVVMGTPQFMAPEQIRGAVADHRSDQFSFCVALYHALHGEFPFTGQQPKDLLDSIQTGIAGLEHRVGSAARLRRVLCRGLSADPAERFANMGELLTTLERGTRLKAVGIVGAVLLFFIAIGVYFLSSSLADPCGRAGDGIASSWSIPRQAAVQLAFSRSGLLYSGSALRGTQLRLDDYTKRLRDQATEACRATQIYHEQSVPVFDRRMLCLQRGHRGVEALVTQLTMGTPETVRGAIGAAESLPDLEACSHMETMMLGHEPPAPTIADDVEVIRKKLEWASTEERLGRSDRSLSLAREALEMTERLDYPPVRAEALVQVARALEGRRTADTRKEAERLYFEALDIAEVKRHDQLSSQIWGRLVMLAVRMDSGMQQAYAWWRRYEAAVGRIAGGPYEQARLHHLRGQIYYHDGKYAEAAQEENSAIAAIEGLAANDQQLELSRYYGARASALERLGQVAEAVSLHERALTIASKNLGPTHPDTIKRRMNYGLTLKKHRQFDRARREFEVALESMSPQDRESTLDAGIVHSYLSNVSYMEMKYDESIAQAQQALQIYERAGAPDRRLAEAYVDMATAEVERKNFAEALSLYERALQLRRELDSDHDQIGDNEGGIAEALAGLERYSDAMGHVITAEGIFEKSSTRRPAYDAWIRTVHGEVLLGQGQWSAAVAMLEQALARFDATADPRIHARAMWALARALHGMRKDPPRVRELAEKARALFATQGTFQARNRDAAERLIEQLSHDPPR